MHTLTRFREDKEASNDSFILKEKYGNYFRVPSHYTVATKVIATIGPGTRSPAMINKLMDAGKLFSVNTLTSILGMGAVRLNASHGSWENFDKIIKWTREAAMERSKIECLCRINIIDRICPIILDTKGPEVRVCKIDNNQVELFPNQDFDLLRDESIVGDNTQVAVTYPDLHATVQPGGCGVIG